MLLEYFAVSILVIEQLEVNGSGTYYNGISKSGPITAGRINSPKVYVIPICNDEQTFIACYSLNVIVTELRFCVATASNEYA